MNIAIVGLGYVGLPLAIEFGKKYRTLGYDNSKNKILSYKASIDPNCEVEYESFSNSKLLEFTHNPDDLKNYDIIIIAVPTPVDQKNIPDLSALIDASRMVGQRMKKNSIIVYEPTVYPGATEEVCIPNLEESSGMKWKKDFNVGYSPERINPGDKERTLTDIIKIVSGDNKKTLKIISELYGSIIKAGVFCASSIKVAEAAKVIENTQRDLNIALMNELAMVFNKIGIDTCEVIDVASTKWNFMPFKPGLVGGHCIGVDPYYLTYKAEMLGHIPQVILAGRKVNDNMALYVAEQALECILKSGKKIEDSKVIILGLAFKENCSDLRNSKVTDLINILKKKGCSVYVNDPVVDSVVSKNQYDIELKLWDQLPKSDAIIAAVSHRQYLEMDLNKILLKLNPNGTFIDIKSSYPELVIKRLGFNVWRL